MWNIINWSDFLCENYILDKWRWFYLVLEHLKDMKIRKFDFRYRNMNCVHKFATYFFEHFVINEQLHSCYNDVDRQLIDYCWCQGNKNNVTITQVLSRFCIIVYRSWTNRALYMSYRQNMSIVGSWEYGHSW